MFYTPAMLNTAQVSNRFIFSDVNRTDSDLFGVTVAGCSWVHKQPNPTEHTSPDTYHLGLLFSFGTESVNGSTCYFGLKVNEQDSLHL